MFVLSIEGAVLRTNKHREKKNVCQRWYPMQLHVEKLIPNVVVGIVEAPRISSRLVCPFYCETFSFDINLECLSNTVS